jgi:hypothetical protein
MTVASGVEEMFMLIISKFVFFIGIFDVQILLNRSTVSVIHNRDIDILIWA